MDRAYKPQQSLKAIQDHHDSAKSNGILSTVVVEESHLAPLFTRP